MKTDALNILEALDTAKTQWYHFSAIIIAGMGFFTDAYDLFSISLVTKLLGRIYYPVSGEKKPGTLPPEVAVVVTGIAFLGALVGHLFFGWLGDKLGRKRAYGVTLTLMCLCSLASGFSLGSTPRSVIGSLCFFRFWLGFGVGGDYPLSSAIMAEYANKKTRGAFIAAVFAMQGFGILSGGLFGMAISGWFGAAYPSEAYEQAGLASTVPEADFVWRAILMTGAVPAALTYYLRTKMPETARYTALVANDAARAASDMSTVLDVAISGVDAEQHQHRHQHKAIKANPSRRRNSFGLFSREFWRRHGRHLIGTASTWFLLDMAFYSQTLFQKDVFTSIGWIPEAETLNALDEVYWIATLQTVITVCSAIPGYWVAVFLIDKVGRVALQVIGFFFMAIFMLFVGFPYIFWKKPRHHVWFVVMYSLTFFFANLGPNVTTFVIPAEIFPARLRTTCHGISAAAGKLGAIIGACGFMFLAQNSNRDETERGYPPGIGVRNTLLIMALVNVLGMFLTFLVPETNGKSLEELSGEMEDHLDEMEFEETEKPAYNSTVPF